MFDQHPRRVCATSALIVQQTRGKPKRFGLNHSKSVGLFFFRLKINAQTKQGMVRLRKKVCLKGNVN